MIKCFSLLALVSLTLSSCASFKAPTLSLSQEQKSDIESSIGNVSALFVLPVSVHKVGLNPTRVMSQKLIAHIIHSAPKELAKSSSLSAQNIPGECLNSAAGVVSDSDQDGIPSNSEFNLSCGYVSERGIVIISGKINIIDEADNNSLSGFSIDRENIKYTLQGTNEYWNYNDDFNISYNGFDYQYEFSGQETNYKNQHQSLSLGGSYSPASTVNTFQAGSIKLDGNALAAISADEIVSLKMQSDQLALNSYCGGNIYVESGTINISASRDNSGAQNYPMVYTECEARW